jgi:hypothetical protein
MVTAAVLADKEEYDEVGTAEEWWAGDEGWSGLRAQGRAADGDTRRMWQP